MNNADCDNPLAKKTTEAAGLADIKETEILQNNDLATKVDAAQHKRKILNPQEYNCIRDFILNYKGLIIECESELIQTNPEIERQTLISVVQTEIWQRTRSQHWKFAASRKDYLTMFEEESENSLDNSILIKIAMKESVPPVTLCRVILQEKYQITNKSRITGMLKYPDLIDDMKLSANVKLCLSCDTQGGPLVDLKLRALGEEYEFKLTQLATEAGMKFHDEKDLRRLGYDKTPDIKLLLPFLYKKKVVHWIESKACFGDPKTHKRFIQQQLNSYTNRFGPGIVIYWFGYRTDTPELSENSVGITVLDDFPSLKDAQFMDLNTHEGYVRSMSETHVNTSIIEKLCSSFSNAIVDEDAPCDEKS